jgi:hypothetical protein
MRASDLSASLPRDEPDGVPDGLVVVLTVGAIVLILFLREAQAEVIRCNLLAGRHEPPPEREDPAAALRTLACLHYEGLTGSTRPSAPR